MICRYFFQVSKSYALNCVFWWQEFLILIKFSLLTSLWFVILMLYLKHFALLKVTEISSCLLIEAFYFGVLHLGLWFILSQFLYGVKYELRFILLHMNVQYSYSSTICWEKYSFSTELPLSKIYWLDMCGSISELSILFQWPIGLSWYQYHAVLTTITL